MILSCCAWALNDSEPETLSLLKDMGLSAIDIRPSWLRSNETLQKREELDLEVICLAATHERPEGATLDSDNAGSVEPMVHHIKEGLDHAARQGAHWSYVVPDRLLDDQTFERYATHLTDIADHAQELDIKVCIEHFPGTAFPTVSSTMDFIHDTGHPNLYLLFDIGHAQMANEDPAEVLSNVDDRLGYVHLNDNDGVNDLHLALTDGVQTTDSLAGLLQILDDISYDDPISLEIKNDLPDPLDSVTHSYEIITNLLG
jgi:sugar phosphate isomerase/epimerase